MVKKYKKKDPHRKREAKKYEHPVPSREHILKYCQDHQFPVTQDHLLKAFALRSDKEQEGLRRRLSAMTRDGQLLRTRKGSYAIVDKLDLLRGRVIGHRDGFGFFIPEDASPDIFLPQREMCQVFSNDKVLVRVVGDSKRKKREGQIVEVLERNTQRIAGKFIEERGLFFVAPDNKTIHQDVHIPPEHRNDATPGQFVVVELVHQPSRRYPPSGKIIEILGDQITAGMEVELAIHSHQLPHTWSKAITEYLSDFNREAREDEGATRKDLRHLPFITIDGEDAKDFDDAVYCEKKSDQQYCLYVAIADVSHYVKPGDLLDTEAYQRGNSVYFPANVIPMLPEELSNDLCSLKPKVDRLTLVCQMDINNEGEVTQYQFYNAVIHSHERFTYTQVAALLDDIKTPSHPLFDHIKNLYQLYLILSNQRSIRGAIEFETSETKVVFDADGKIKEIVPVIRNVAHKMIEEAMLIANVTASRFIEKSKIPTLYRVHEQPNLEKLTALRDFLKTFSLRLTGGSDPTPLDFAKLIKRIATREDSQLLQTVILRSLHQAVYHPENMGHFGLSYSGYTHFTSPIRRYPDLLVHRAIKHIINSNKKQTFPYDTENMNHMAEHCSATERRADKASRDALDWLKCDFLQGKVGDILEGIIIDITSFGFFVELKNVYVQGLVHITSLKNDYYTHDSVHHALIGRQSGKTYRLGDEILVQIARVDMDQRKIDFELV